MTAIFKIFTILLISVLSIYILYILPNWIVITILGVILFNSGLYLYNK